MAIKVACEIGSLLRHGFQNGRDRDGGCSASPRALLQSARLSIARQIFSLFSSKSLFGIHHLSGLLPRIAFRTSHLACLDNVDVGASSAGPCDRRLPSRYIQTSDTHDNILLLPDLRSRMSLVFLRFWGRLRSISAATQAYVIFLGQSCPLRHIVIE